MVSLVFINIWIRETTVLASSPSFKVILEKEMDRNLNHSGDVVDPITKFIRLNNVIKRQKKGKKNILVNNFLTESVKYIY